MTYPSVYGPVYGGGFPLDLKVALNLAGTWTDITQWAYQRTTPAFTITRGRPDETAQVSPSQMTGQLNNRDGRFTSRNPVGPYYGQLGRNTPIRLSVPAQYATLRIEDDTASAAAVASFTPVTGDIDVRLEMDLSGWSPANLISSWPNWALVLNGDGTLGWWITQSSTVTVVASQMPVPLDHGAVRVTRAHSTGVVTFYTAATISGAWTQLGAAVTSVTGLLGAAAAALTVGYDAGVTGQTSAYGGPSGRFYDAQVLSGIGGTLEAWPAFTSQTEGTTTWTDAQANPWAVAGTAGIDGRSYRYHGEMSSLPVAWDTSGHDIWVPFTAGGVLRRLQQGTSPVMSPMRRGITSLPGGLYPVAYWPCEDGGGATSIGSGIGGPAMTVAGHPSFAANTDFVCSAALPSLDGSVWKGTVPAYTGGTQNVVMGLLEIPSGGDTNGAVLFSVMTTGTLARLDLVYNSDLGGGLTMNAYNRDGSLNCTTGEVNGDPGNIDGTLSQFMMVLEPSGGDVWPWFEALPIADPADSAGAAVNPVSGTIGHVTAVLVNPQGKMSGTVVGHISVHASDDSSYSLVDYSLSSPLHAPIQGWAGETAGNRFARICAENGIEPRVYGYPDVTQPMGVQPVDTLVNILQQCETADMGMMYEPSECLGIGYRTLASMLSQDPAVTLDYSAAQVGDQENSPVSLTSVDDDQYTRNYITATQAGAASGSAYTAMLDDGSPMSVSPPTAVPAGVGVYDNSVSINTESDTQLPDAASWLVHIGTVAGERYPQVVAGLHRLPVIAAGLGYSIQDVRIGDYVEVVNTPGWLPPGGIRQIVAGVTETLTSFLFQVSWNAVPESPYETAVADDLVYGRADTDGSALDAGVSSTAASMSVAAPSTGGGGGGGGGGVVLQPSAGYAVFGCFAGGNPAYPNRTYNGSTYESANMANRQVGAFQEYYALDGGSGGTVPLAAAQALANAGRIISFDLVPSYTKPPASGPATTVAAGSNGVNVSTFTGSGVLHAASSSGYPGTGTLLVVRTSGAVVKITYTGTGSGTFTGCTTTSGSGTLATGNGVATAGSYGAVTIGAYDTLLGSIAAVLSGLANPSFVEFASEFDLGSMAAYGTASDYIAAYQHIASLLRAGAPGQVAMAWVMSQPGTGRAAYYPGDAYVDWLGCDPYDPTGSIGSPTATYQPFITWLNTDPLAVAGGAGSGGGHGMPLGIFETGVEPTAGNQAAWIAAVPAALASGALTTTWSSQIQFWSWFNDLTGTWNTAITPGSASAANLATIGATSFFNPPAAGLPPVTEEPLWTTAAGDFPFDVDVGGEQITVTSIAGTTSPQAFTVVRSVNGVVKAQTAGADVRLFYPPAAALI
jgi:hypothetical protein